jgi:hypothetical protein
MGLESVEIFLRQLEGVKPAPSKPRPASSQKGQPPAAAAAVKPPDSVGELRELQLLLARKEEEISRLERQIQTLEQENGDLKVKLSKAVSAPAPPAPDPRAAAKPQELHHVVAALLGDKNPPSPASLSTDRVLAGMQELRTYFEGTHRNLQHVFRKLKIPVQLPTFPEALERALAEGKGLLEYLECLRDCWKILVGGTWNHLEAWCKKLESGIDPQKIEEFSKQQNLKPWDFYKDLFNKMAIHNNLIDQLRLQIKSQIRDRHPEIYQ